MKCHVIIPELKSTLGNVYLCRKDGRVFVSHRNRYIGSDEITWNVEEVPEEYKEYITHLH